VAVDYATRHASLSGLAAPTADGSWPGVDTRLLETSDVEPLRAEIESFIDAAERGATPVVTGEDGRRALALALRILESIHAHTAVAGLSLKR
jgi:predicted dehydrogenase